MLRYALRRIMLGFLTIFLVSLVVFVASRLSGDVVYLLLPQDATEHDVANMRTRLGLDKSLPVQYLIYLKGAVTGDFGKSYRYTNRPALDIVLERLPATMQLAFSAFGISIISGLSLVRFSQDCF